jgi:anti-anti-sigma factor
VAKANLLIQRVGEVTVVDLQEARILDASLVEQLGQELYRLVDGMNRKKLILDFSKVRFLSSAAISVLLVLRKKVAAVRGTLVICGLRRELKEVFDIMNINKLFKFCVDEQEAMKALGLPA